MLPLSHTLTTPRFRLRFPTAQDIPRIFSATRHEGFNDGMLWEPPTSEEELRIPLKRNTEAWKSGQAYQFSILSREDEILLGRISIRRTDHENVWNVGFWTHPEVHNQGVMTEALGAVLAFGFGELTAIRIEARHALWNHASEKVLKKNGFQFVRYLPQGFQKGGEWVEENLLAIDKEDYTCHA
ncbi:MAG: GNAT family protein [Bacteroidota bacterium]